MKRMCAILMSALMLLSLVVYPVVAAEPKTTQVVEYLPDGSYVVTVIEEQDTHGVRTNTKVGTKTTSRYNPNNVLQWKMAVTGEFLYDGTTVTCTYASGVTNVYNSEYWEVTQESATVGTSTAYYYVTFAYWSLGVVIDRPAYSINISCDPDGNLY